MYVLVLTEKTVIFPQSVILEILVFFISQDDAHYQNHQNDPSIKFVYHCTVIFVLFLTLHYKLEVFIFRLNETLTEN